LTRSSEMSNWPIRLCMANPFLETNRSLGC